MRFQNTVPFQLLFSLVFQCCSGSSTAPVPSTSYRVGDEIDAEVTVLNRDRNPLRLLEQVRDDARVIVLILFGGGAADPPDGAFRGPLWCEDSFDDLAVQRALIHEFEGPEVQFLAVAVPPVFAPVRYGFPDGVFAPSSGVTAGVRDAAVRQFIESTLRQQRSSLLPYPELFFDPNLELLRRPDAGEHPQWTGKFKWDRDSRKYGVPTIWILDRTGRVVCEPFWGNEYGVSPPRIRYGYSDLRDAVRDALERAPRGK